jgi:hypothetical protein
VGTSRIGAGEGEQPERISPWSGGALWVKSRCVLSGQTDFEDGTTTGIEWRPRNRAALRGSPSAQRCGMERVIEDGAQRGLGKDVRGGPAPRETRARGEACFEARSAAISPRANRLSRSAASGTCSSGIASCPSQCLHWKRGGHADPVTTGFRTFRMAMMLSHKRSETMRFHHDVSPQLPNLNLGSVEIASHPVRPSKDFRAMKISRCQPRHSRTKPPRPRGGQSCCSRARPYWRRV